MRKCAICGSGHMEITQHIIRGYDNITNKKAVRMVNICECCDAWGMATEEGTLFDLAGLYKKGE